MADIHIHRKHDLGLAGARKMACAWRADAENKLEMRCNYTEGQTSDCVSFARSGVSGTLVVTNDGFELKAKLGFLVSAYKDKIEAEIGKNLDAMLAKESSKQGTKKTSATAAGKATTAQS